MTTIRPWIPRVAALAVPLLVAVAITLGGRRLAQDLLLAGAVVLLFFGLTALVAYMLTTGQFPPRISRSGVDLPADEVDATGKSLALVQDAVRLLGARVERIEAHLGLEEDEPEAGVDADSEVRMRDEIRDEGKLTP